MQDLTDSPLAAVCCGKLREMFYGLRAVKTVLADLTGFPSVAVCCGKLRENLSVGECCSGEWYEPVQA